MVLEVNRASAAQRYFCLCVRRKAHQARAALRAGEAGMEGTEMRQLGSVDPGGQRWGLCTERMEMIQE